MTSSQRIKLVYICGYGRSGTTLLDIFLGQNESIFGAGEITTLARHVWVNNEYCACGSAVHHCPFWRDIIDRWQAGEDSTLLSDYREAQEMVEGIFSRTRTADRLGFKTRLRDYIRQSSKLLTIISDVTRRPVIVDSSKLPGRGFALSSVPEIDLYVVHMVRDGRGVCWSLMKPYKRQVESGLQKDIKPKSWLYTALRWTAVNLAAEVLCRQVGKARSIRVRYEDFVSDPQTVLSRIVALVEGQAQDASARYHERPNIRPGHQVAGNRLRMQKSIEFKRDESWREGMPLGKQLAFSICCGMLLRRYGYPLLPGSAASCPSIESEEPRSEGGGGPTTVDVQMPMSS